MELSDSLMVMYDGELWLISPMPQGGRKRLGSYMLGLKKQSKEEIRGSFYVEPAAEPAV